MNGSYVAAKHKQLVDSKGWLVTQRLKWIESSLSVFHVNHQHVVAYIDRLSDEDVVISHLLGEERYENVEKSFNEVYRLTHNWLLSASMLVEHTRNLIREWFARKESIKKNKKKKEEEIVWIATHPFFDEYLAEVAAQFASNARCRLIAELRNYIAHCTLPPLQLEAHIDISEKRYSNSVCLIRDNMKAHSIWSPTAMMEIEKLDQLHPLLPLLEEHHIKVINFHRWLNLTIRHHYRQELIQAQLIQDQLREISSPQDKL